MLFHGTSYQSAFVPFAAFLICACAADTLFFSSSSKYPQIINIINPATGKNPCLSSHDLLRNNVQSQIYHQRSSIATLPPRSLSHSPPTTWNWNLVFQNWQSFPPSSFAANAMTDLYVSIHDKLGTYNHSSMELTTAHIISFTYRNLRCTFQSIGQAVVPFSIAVITQVLNTLIKMAKAGLVGLGTVILTFLTIQVVWAVVVVVVTVVANVGVGNLQNIIS